VTCDEGTDHVTCDEGTDHVTCDEGTAYVTCDEGTTYVTCDEGTTYVTCLKTKQKRVKINEPESDMAIWCCRVLNYDELGGSYRSLSSVVYLWAGLFAAVDGVKNTYKILQDFWDVESGKLQLRHVVGRKSGCVKLMKRLKPENGVFW
jgi:hypothetical protein